MNLQGVRDVRSQVILADEGRSGEVSEIECFDLERANMRILQALFAGFDGEREQVAIRKRPESGLANAHDGNRSHILSLGQISSTFWGLARHSDVKVSYA